MERTNTVRPTKKQRQLLEYIAGFIDEHGYSPSYREIMNGCDYTSVATVALHVNSLIKRGHLRKRDHSARSLEVVDQLSKEGVGTESDTVQGHQQWLLVELRRAVKELKTTAENPDVELEAIERTMLLLGLPEHAAVATVTETAEHSK